MNLRPIRLDRGLLQAELADRIGVSNRTISSYECGTRNPPIRLLEALAKALNCTPNDLLSTDDRPA